MGIRSLLRGAALGAVVAVAALTSGCATKAEQQAEDGLSDFESCNLRGASQAFANAHSDAPERGDFALAYALSTIAVLPEDSHVTSVLERLGFTGPIDTSKFWGNGGVFDQLSSRDAACHTITDEIQAAIPYAPAQTNGPSVASQLADRTLTGADFVSAAVALLPRLISIESALEQGTAAMGEVDIKGGCGVGEIHVEAPELYGLASLLEWLIATIQAAEAYDWAIDATVALDSGREQDLATELDAHLFHLKDPAALTTSLASAQHATDLLETALTAVRAVRSRPANSLFDWTALPPIVLSDTQTLVDGLKHMLAAAGPQPLPFFMPALAMDAQSFFTAPFDLTNASPAAFSSSVSYTDTNGTVHYQVDTSSAVFDNLLAPRFSPDPFASNAPGYSLGYGSNWNITSSQWSATFDPDHRWENAYGCQ